ncbi:PA14 domain-containing protein [Ferrovibrio sp.]|uniref:PA14 domain-containing protein n=1 Tax=Ferrovibrio sp. TaxID=1917215 RepID=UPI003516AC41
MTAMRRRHLLAVFMGGLLLLGGLPDGARAQGAPKPLSPQPAAGAVKPGLVPTYYRNITFNYIDEVLRHAKDAKGEAGKPIPNIDSISDGQMWDAGMRELYGIRIDGLIRLPAGATYFATNSNDGVRVILGGAQILEDGDVHADRLSDPVEVKVATAGWYPLRIWYFQKKNTATLQLLWQPPGAAEFKPVPPEAFGHQ